MDIILTKHKGFVRLYLDICHVIYIYDETYNASLQNKYTWLNLIFTGLWQV